MKLIKVFLVMLFVTACSMSTSSYDLSTMPKYDMAVAEKEWSVVAEISERESELAMTAMMLGMSGAVVSESEIEKIKPLYDQLLYWKAVTELHVFHGQYAKAKESASKANDSIESILFILSGVKPQGVSL